MILSATAISAFQMAAGVSPDKMNFFLRTILLAITFIWASWCVYGEVNHYRHHGVDIFDMFRKTYRILFMVVLMTMLVFIK